LRGWLRLQGICGSGFEGAGAITAEFFVEGFEAVNEIGQVFSRVHASGGFTKVGAAAEGAMRINGAAAIAAEQWAGPIGVSFELSAATGADAFGEVQSLTEGEKRRFAGEAKMAAATAELAITREGAALDLGIDSLDLRRERGGRWAGGRAAGHAVGWNEPKMAVSASFLLCEQLKFEKFPFRRHLSGPQHAGRISSAAAPNPRHLLPAAFA
jgi:hypothetical protein